MSFPGEGSTAQVAADRAASPSGLDLPSATQLLSEFPQGASSLPARGTETLDPEAQDKLFRSLKNIIENSEGTTATGNNFDLKELHASLEQADSEARHGRRGTESLDTVKTILYQLWAANSGLLVQAAEVLANGSRDPSWRGLFGQSGILKFFLDIISSNVDVETGLKFHSLRLVGNSCADTDENRQIVVGGKYILPIIQQFLDPDLIQVAIPVVYNICMDFEPAHAQIAEYKTAYILLRLLKDGTLQENSALLSFSYDLVELASEQAQGVENSPDGTILLMMELAQNEETAFEHFATLVTCLSTYLEKERFQNACVSHHMVEQLLSVLKRSFTFKIDTSSKEEVQALTQSRLKINQALSEVSASPLFAAQYPLNSPLAQTLKTWIVGDEDQLQICACVMLGNLARSDEVCQVMVRDLKIHEELISVLNSDARGAVLHSAIGFLKNLAIAGDNRLVLGQAGLIPAVSRLWAFESVPQVQFAAASIARQLIISSVDNIVRLLAQPSAEPDTPASRGTCLSMLLELFGKSDSAPIKTEIGRSITSICRTLSPLARDGDEQAAAILEKFYRLHEGVARPVGAMITQTQWPVVRSEGWFALALMATTKSGCAAVADCLRDEGVMELLKKTVASDEDNAEEKEKAQLAKDRDNVFVLVQELLTNEAGELLEEYRSTLEDLMKEHAPRHLQGKEV